MNLARHVVVVDPFSSGRLLATELAADGWDVTGIITSRDIPAWSHSVIREEDFGRVIDDLPFDDLVACLAPLGVTAVIAGSETGVPLSDRLAERLQVAGNGPALSAARRDKSLMADRLRACGVPAAEHLVTGDLDELVEWCWARREWPVVVKPVASAASDQIHVCGSVDDLHQAFGSIIGSVDVLGTKNEVVLAQEFLRGQQYLLNTASTDGYHYIGEIWRFDSFYEEGAQIYDKQELLESTGELQDALVDYGRQVLEALGIRHGAAHTEIMMTARGPILIECAARMTGGVHRPALQQALGYDHVTITREAYLTPEFLRARPAAYELRSRLGIVALRSRVAGSLAEGRALKQLTELKSVVGCTGSLAAGTPVEPTRGMLSSPGLLYLAAPSLEEILRDTRTVRRLEASGELYQAVT